MNTTTDESIILNQTEKRTTVFSVKHAHTEAEGVQKARLSAKEAKASFKEAGNQSDHHSVQ